MERKSFFRYSSSVSVRKGKYKILSALNIMIQ